MGKTRVSIRSKMYHLGLTVVDAAAIPPTNAASVASIASVASTPNPNTNHTTPDQAPSEVPVIDHTPTACAASPPGSNNVDAPVAQPKKDEPLPTIEEQLHVLNAAIVALQRPGLGRDEIARHSKIIDGVKAYNDLFPKFVNYRGLEQKVLELEKKLASEKTP